MSSLADIAEKHARILGELAEFGLNLARKLHDQGMAAETPQETADLARAFHSVSRSVRQTLALEARLARDARLQDDADRAEAGRLEHNAWLRADEDAKAPTNDRKNRIGAVVQRLIQAEYEDEDEAERLCDEAYDRIIEDARTPDFLDHAIDDQIARLCKDFGLPLPPRPIARLPERSCQTAATPRNPQAPPLPP
ncbi:hypothetical protein [Phenylobacterium sp.]|uniref:hypothetical protein n=1 Tax=Phenylobacterium sp. TaxID=1871053 RepID=UPI00374D11FC